MATKKAKPASKAKHKAAPSVKSPAKPKLSAKPKAGTRRTLNPDKDPGVKRAKNGRFLPGHRPKFITNLNQATARARVMEVATRPVPPKATPQKVAPTAKARRNKKVGFRDLGLKGKNMAKLLEDLESNGPDIDKLKPEGGMWGMDIGGKTTYFANDRIGDLALRFMHDSRGGVKPGMTAKEQEELIENVRFTKLEPSDIPRVLNKKKRMYAKNAENYEKYKRREKREKLKENRLLDSAIRKYKESEAKAAREAARKDKEQAKFDAQLKAFQARIKKSEASLKKQEKALLEKQRKLEARIRAQQAKLREQQAKLRARQAPKKAAPKKAVPKKAAPKKAASKTAKKGNKR
jgi:hypothetical protein